MKKLILAIGGLYVAVSVLWVQEVYSHNPVTTTVLFNREISAVFNAKCVQCHVEDGMAMSLQTHAQARPWAIAIKEEVLARRMPPWPAERGYGAFANDGGLTPRELEFLISWIDGGVPEGAGKPPDHVDHSSHWMLGRPDGEYTASPGHTAASEHTASPDHGDDRASGVSRFIVDPGFREDTWVRAIDLKVPDKRTARAAFFTVVGTGQYLGGWTPWHTETEFPAGAAFRLPAGARIAVDVHHAPGTPVVDLPRMALYVTPKAEHALEVIDVIGEAPAGERRVRATASIDAPRAIVAFRVELSPGGTSVELNARRPDGVFEPLVWIKKFSHDWQVPFVLSTPVTLPAGSVIQATTYFDTSASSAARSVAHLVTYEPGGAPGAATTPAVAHAH